MLHVAESESDKKKYFGSRFGKTIRSSYGSGSTTLRERIKHGHFNLSKLYLFSLSVISGGLEFSYSPTVMQAIAH